MSRVLVQMIMVCMLVWPCLAAESPELGASQAEINTFLSQLAAQPETHVHSAGSSMAGEHTAALNLVPRGAASHVAIGDGDWFDPSTWSSGQVPGDGAKVLIPEGVTVNYSGVSNASLFTVRVDGVLDFDTQVDSKMVFDTVVVSPSGHLIIGSPTDPVNPNVDIDLVVANNGPIDTNWDPMLLSRGLISHGGTSIHGAVKDSHEKVEDDPMAGDASVKFAGVPQGWEVGDTIVIAGTHYDGYAWDNNVKAVTFNPSEDEVRFIAAIDPDGTIHLDRPLTFDHDAPRADLKTSVANYTRNVSIETENAAAAEVYERGHVMFMHSDNVDVRYAEFHELGRTDKSNLALDVSDIHSVNKFSNVQGRYALHLHRTGTTDIDDPAIVIGNAVYGSPGWGYVHHDANALLENNASYDTFGAGFVAETGNEIGAWNDNIAIFAQGVIWQVPKVVSDLSVFDIARTGDGFWFQGRMVESTDNIAASVNHGFVYFHRNGDNRMIRFDASLFEYPSALHFRENAHPELTPILVFTGNEAFAARRGLHVVKAGTNQGHDVWSQMKKFTAWSVLSGAYFEYTSHYILSSFDVVSRGPGHYLPETFGIGYGNNVTEMVIKDSRITNFNVGIDLYKKFVGDVHGNPNEHQLFVLNTFISGQNRAVKNFTSGIDTFRENFQPLNSEVNLLLGEDLVYTNPNTWAPGLIVTGKKIDSLGDVEFLGGVDNLSLYPEDAMRILRRKGYFRTSNNTPFFELDVHMTDRYTGQVVVKVVPVIIQVSPAPLSSFVFNGKKELY